MPYIVFDSEAAAAGLPLGGKAAALAHLYGQNLPIPRWFVVTPRACEESLMAGKEPGTEFLQELAKALGTLAPGKELLAVRSSAMEEDGSEQSYAGLLESHLFVPPDQVLDKIVDIWQSAFSERVRAYRAEHGQPPPSQPPAVLVQRMIHSDSAGVAFSADPVSGQHGVAVISAIFGLGSALVSGECNADTIYIGPNQEVFQYQVAYKSLSHHLDPTGGIRVSDNTPELAQSPVLHPDQARVIARLARTCEAIFGCPQDIEWAIEGEQLFLLQSRPITTLSRQTDPTLPEWTEWDNGTLIESWNGPVTPLTYSLARLLVGTVYKELSTHTCVPKVPVAELDPIFQNLLGQIQGRIYLNQSRLNHIWLYTPSLEYMLGKSRTVRLDTQERSGLNRQLGRLIWTWFTLTGRNRRFIRQVDQLLKETQPGSDDNLEALLGKQKTMRAFIRDHWTVPALNNFLATSFYRILGWMSATWLGDPALPNAWLADEGDTLSRELSRHLNALAGLARNNPDLTAALMEGNRDALKRFPQFEQKLQAYLARYGERCQDDLKMESPSLAEDTTPLFQTILFLSRQERKLSQQASSRVRLPEALSFKKKLQFSFALNRTRAQVKNRERLRFELTRIMDRFRTLSRAIGKRLQETGLLEESGDILFLSLEETEHRDINKMLIHARKTAFQDSLAVPSPPSRFGEFGLLRLNLGASMPPGAGTLQGIGCSAGTVSGQVRKILPGQTPADLEGKILVAGHGDPGLVTVFPLVKGLLFENGSALSHAAIVARELGVPAITALEGLMSWLEDGDWVEMDGASGQVRRIDQPADSTSTSVELNG